MAHFETDAEVYDQLGGILTNLVGNTSRLEQLRQADAVVQFAFRSPDAKVTLDVRAGKAPRVELGDSRMRPDVVLAMDAAVGHALLHGELSATVALARGDVRLKGNVAKVLRVVPVTVGAHEVEADQPVEATVAGQEPETTAAAEAQGGGDAAPAESGDAAPAGDPGASQNAPGYEASESPAEGGPGAPASEDAQQAGGGVDAEALATAEAADAAGGEEPPAASEEQQQA